MCEGEYGTEYRRVVYSKFVSKEPVSKTSEFILDGLNIKSVEADIDSGIKNEYEDLIDDEVGIFDKIIGKFVSFIGQYDKLNDYFLTVYSQVDSHPFIFTGTVILLFGLYRFL